MRKDADRLTAALAARNVPHDVKVYPEAGHDFMNQKRGIIPRLMGYRPLKVGNCPAEEEDSWQRVLTFFRTNLGAGSISG